MIYATYEALTKAFEDGDIDDAEYRKYFARTTGQQYDGYPDFTQQYFDSFTQRRPKAGGRRAYYFVVVKSLCNSFGDVISVRSASVFLRRRDAMAFLNGLEGTALTSRERVVRDGPEYFLYKLVEEDGR